MQVERSGRRGMRVGTVGSGRRGMRVCTGGMGVCESVYL